MKTKRSISFLSRILLILGLFFALTPVRSVYAFQVEPLPADNLIKNPWFRDSTDPTAAGLDFWVNVNNFWTHSQKISNPSPDSFFSNRCDGTIPTYCGTSAKLSADDGNGQVGVDSYLYQITPANPAHKKLRFSIHWVAHYVNPFEVKIYGSGSGSGPWTLVWAPLHQEVLTFITPPPGYDTSWLWIEMTSWTPPVETILPIGYPYYKVEIRANLPEPDGFKTTGVYFATEFAGELVEEPTQTPTPTPNPRYTPAPTGTPTPTYILTPTSTPTYVLTPTSTPTKTQTPKFTPTQTATPTNTATSNPRNTPAPTSTPTPTYIFTPTSTPTKTQTRGG